MLLPVLTRARVPAPSLMTPLSVMAWPAAAVTVVPPTVKVPAPAATMLTALPTLRAWP